MDAGVQLARSRGASTKVAEVLQKRLQTANESFARRVNEATASQHVDPLSMMTTTMDLRNWYSSAVDATQRSVLFLDTLWQRGNNFIENTAQGLRVSRARLLLRRRPATGIEPCSVRARPWSCGSGSVKRRRALRSIG